MEYLKNLKNFKKIKDKITQSQKILRVKGGEIFEEEDLLLKEALYRLEVNGQSIAQAAISPYEEDLWAIGVMYCKKIIASMNDIKDLKIKNGVISVITENAVCHTENIKKPQENIIISLDIIKKGIEHIAHAPIFNATGAAHVVCLLTPQGEIKFTTEDVGRHNALDKAIGWCVKNAINPATLAVITSGRLPADMVDKAACVGFELMASVSAATAGGVRAARECGMTLIGFVRGDKMNVYANSQRLKEFL